MIRKRKHANLVLPLTSFGDIAFLMIIFFMLVSNFMKKANMEMVPAVSSSLDKQDAPKVNVTMDEDGVIWYEGNPCSPQELTGLLKMRAEDLRDEPVHVSIHKSHPRRTFMPVIEAVSEAGLKMVLTGELEE
jgi:biopolymer transport protein ExbD